MTRPDSRDVRIVLIKSSIAVVVVLGQVIGCTSSDLAPDGMVTIDGSGSGSGSGTAGLRATVNGVLVEFDQGARAYGPEGTAVGRTSVMGQATSPFRGLTLGLDPHAVGTYTCSSGAVVSFLYSSSDGQATAQSTQDCTITLEQAGTAAGAEWIGTFSGNLAANGGFTAAVTNGYFRLPMFVP